MQFLPRFVPSVVLVLLCLLNSVPGDVQRRNYGCNTEYQEGMWSQWSYSNCYCDGLTQTGFKQAERTCQKVLKILSTCALYCPGSDSKLVPCDDECCFTAVDGGWAQWGDYSDCVCSADGAGLQTAYRACDNPVPSCGGAKCARWWLTRRTLSCDSECCQRVAGGWSWPTWSDCKCDEATGTGTKTGSRTCTDPSPACGGSQCEGESTQHVQCDEECCKRSDGGWNEWSSWGECVCEDTTGTGYQTSERECTNPSPACGGENCSGYSSRVQKCDDECCKRVDGGWSWGVWSNCVCDNSTGTGTRTSTRICDNPKPSCGGSKCLGSSVETHSCDEMCCQQLNGGWSNWAPWSRCDCDISIGSGTRTKERTCSNPVPECGGIGCEGDLIVAETCTDSCCAKVDGSWSNWGEWGDCVCDTTGSGLRMKKRKCSNPAHSCGGEPCQGNSTMTEPCDDSCCRKVNGGWSWPVWGDCKCDHDTGTGVKTATRSCTHPKPYCGGEVCVGELKLDERCDAECCKTIDAGWSEWSGWGQCKCDSITGTGVMMNNRSCDNPTASCGGNYCTGSDSTGVDCSEKCCKLPHGAWSTWGEWGQCKCDYSTGKGLKSANRTCTTCGGNNCTGNSTREEWCNDLCCIHTDGAWTTWSPWVGTCYVTCDGSKRYRNRTCTSPNPSCFGDPCSGSSSLIEECDLYCTPGDEGDTLKQDASTNLTSSVLGIITAALIFSSVIIIGVMYYIFNVRRRPDMTYLNTSIPSINGAPPTPGVVIANELYDSLDADYAVPETEENIYEDIETLGFEVQPERFAEKCK